MNQPTTRRVLLASLIAVASLTALTPLSALAYDPQSHSELNVDAHGIAVLGYDVVAYFTAGAPTVGRPEFTATHQGATYRFASAAHRDTFLGKPSHYVPQFGGFCAMGVALDQKLDGDPSAWRIVDDKLYLNVNKDIQKKWLEDVPGNLVKANQAWPKIKGIAPKDL
jgi:YHS domain-containing protein